jgi:Mrp family chromosome partitioning ATPase
MDTNSTGVAPALEPFQLERSFGDPGGLIEESRSGRGQLFRDHWRADHSATIDQAKLLVYRLFLAPNGVQSVLFAGMTAQSGCTSVVFNVAEMLAASTPKSVCMVDANAYSPYLNNLYDLANTKGLSDALIEGRSVTEYVKRLDHSNLSILPFGSRPTIETEKRGRCFWIRETVTTLTRQFDYVIVDAPSASEYSDAIALGSCVGGLALVMRAGKTKREIARRVTTAMREANVAVLGVVLTTRDWK